MPDGLTELYCSNNSSLIHLPDHLPDGLIRLYCNNNPSLTHLPFELLIKKVDVVCNNKMKLYKNNASMRIYKWYKMRKILEKQLLITDFIH